jgi:tetratricopeptide (TPR) repeat protein
MRQEAQLSPLGMSSMRQQRHHLAIALFLLGVASHARAATLKGVLLSNEVGGPPVANVQVTAVGANPATSGSDGIFTLQFPAKPPGEMVHLVVRDRGLVVVNDIQLHLRLPLPQDAEKELLTLLLSREGDREEMARRFYRLRFSEASDQTYQKRFKELEATNQANTAALADLRKERDQAKASAVRAAEELARLRPGTSSELYQQAMSLFLANKVEEALKLLDQEKLRSSVEAARRRKAEDDKEIAEAIQAYLLKAQLLVTRFRFAEADKTYQAAIAAAPDSFDAQFALASFNHGLNRFPQALTAYARSLELAQRNGDGACAACTLNALGILHSTQNRMVEARHAYDEALKTFREAARQKPETFLPDLAMTLNNLGNLHKDQNRMAEARQAYDEALKIYRELAQKNPRAYREDLACTLNNLGILNRTQYRLGEAGQAYEEALGIERELTRESPETHLPGLALTLNNLGFLRHAQNRMGDARQAYDEALKIRRDLARQNPETYLTYVASTLNNMGVLLRDQGRMDESLKVFDEALEIGRGLARRNAEAYLPQLTETLNNLGTLFRDQNLMEESLHSYEEALSIRRELARQSPETYLPRVAETLNNLGILHRDQNRLDEAQQAYMESLNIRRELARKNPETYLPELAETLANLGMLRNNQNRLGEAREALEEALAIYERLAKRGPLQYELKVAQVKDLLRDLPGGN